jgi:hypothetical protein
MSRLDDELRSTLHAHAFDVVPSPDLVARITSRAKRTRRRQNTGKVLAGALAFSLIGFGVPWLTRHTESPPEHAGAASWHAQHHHGPAAPPPGGNAGPAPENTLPTADAVPLGSRQPVNYLDWSPRGQRPPSTLTSYAMSYLYQTSGAAPGQLHLAPLWSGQVSDKQWVTVVQSWTTSAKAGASIAVIDTFTAAPDGSSPRLATSGALYFRHAGANEDPVLLVTSMQRVRLFTIELTDGQVLAIGAPDITSIAYAPDGQRFQPEATVDGVAYFQRNAREFNGIPIDLVQAASGTQGVVTAADSAATRYASFTGQATPSTGWGIADFDATAALTPDDQQPTPTEDPTLDDSSSGPGLPGLSLAPAPSS